MRRFGHRAPLTLLVFLALGLFACDAIETGTLSDEDIGDVIDVGGTITELLGDTATDLSNDPDPAVQSAGESATAVEREREKEASGDPLDPGKIVDVLENLPLGQEQVERQSANPDDDPLSPDKILDALERAPLGNSSPPSSSSQSSGESPFEDVYKDIGPSSPSEAEALVETDPRNYVLRLNQAVAEVAAGESPEAAKAAAFYLINKYEDIGWDTPEMAYLFRYINALDVAIRGGETSPGERERLVIEYCAQTELWDSLYGLLFPFPPPPECG